MQEFGPSPGELKDVSRNILRNTDDFMGLWAMVASSFTGNKTDDIKEESLDAVTNALAKSTKDAETTSEAEFVEKDSKEAEEKEAKRQMFQTAESAVEAWTMLATSLGGQSVLKSEFEKICFVENRRTDTQVGV